MDFDWIVPLFGQTMTVIFRISILFYRWSWYITVVIRISILFYRWSWYITVIFRIPILFYRWSWYITVIFRISILFYRWCFIDGNDTWQLFFDSLFYFIDGNDTWQLQFGGQKNSGCVSNNSSTIRWDLQLQATWMWIRYRNLLTLYPTQ